MDNMKELSNEHNAKYDENSNHIYLENLMRGLEQAILELRDAIRIHDRRVRVGVARNEAITSVIGAALGLVAIIFTTILAVDTTRQFHAVGQRLDNIGEP